MIVAVGFTYLLVKLLLIGSFPENFKCVNSKNFC